MVGPWNDVEIDLSAEVQYRDQTPLTPVEAATAKQTEGEQSRPKPRKMIMVKMPISLKIERDAPSGRGWLWKGKLEFPREILTSTSPPTWELLHTHKFDVEIVLCSPT